MVVKNTRVVNWMGTDLNARMLPRTESGWRTGEKNMVLGFFALSGISFAACHLAPVWFFLSLWLLGVWVCWVSLVDEVELPLLDYACMHVTTE